MDWTPKAQKERIEALHRSVHTIRATLKISELSAAWIDVLLIIASTPGLPLSEIQRGSELVMSSVQRCLIGLGGQDKSGKTGLGLIEHAVDPRHGARRLYFLSTKGRSLMADVLTALTGEVFSTYAAPTAAEFLTRFEAEQAARPGRVNPKAFTPQAVMVGKRALKRRGVSVGPHTVAFPLAPASRVIDQIEEWVQEQEGVLYRLPTIAKPDGMVIVDLPTPEHQVFFHLRWVGPV